MPADDAPRANLAFPTRYRFGWGRRAELVAEARGAGITRALVVTDAGVARQPWAAAVLDAVRAELDAVVVDAIGGDPTEPELLAGVRAFVDAGCDGVVAIGGGSPMDAAKVIALVAGHRDVAPVEPGVCAAFAVGGARARQIRAAAVPPIVAMPTTSGTGSEVSTGAVVTDPDARVKRTVLHPALLPRAVVADPEVTVGLPPALTAATALDALTHAIEAACAPGYHPMCDAIALEAIRLVVAHLPRAVAAGDDARARSELMMAASMAAVAFHKGLGLVHAMAHPLGAATGVHHGLANAVLLPHVLDVNRAGLEATAPRLADAVGAGGAPGDPVDLVIDAVVALEREVGIPATLAPATLGPDPEAAIAALTRLALDERLYLATNPRPVDAAEVAGVYRRAFGLA